MLDYLRNIEQTMASAFIGIACEDTQPAQPVGENVAYIAGVEQNSSVTFQHFKDSGGRPVKVNAGTGSALIVVLLWNKKHWSYQLTSNEFIASGKENFISEKLPYLSSFSGLGRNILYRNPVVSEGVTKNILTQEILDSENTIYHIRYDFDLDGKTINMPDNCILQFDGGFISNGVVEGNYSIGNEFVTPFHFGFGKYSHDSVFEIMVSVAESSGCAISIPEMKVHLSGPVLTTQKVLENRGVYADCRLVYSEDEFLPRVTPNMSIYGFFKYQIIDFISGNPEKGYYANQSIAYDPDPKGAKLLFGIKHAPDDTDDAYVYITDMNLKEIRHVLLQGTCHINDMMFSSDYSQLMIAPLYWDKKYPIKSKIRIYNYPSLSLRGEIDLAVHFGSNTSIDALCNAFDERCML